jgi:DNA-binding response OmpR family regulator
VVPRVLLAATFEVSARLASLLARRDVIDVDTSLNVVTAIRKATTTAYDVVVLDLSLRGAFLLLDMLRTIGARQRPLVIALRGDEQERAILDSDVVTAVLAAGQVEMSGDVIIQLARVGARKRIAGAPDAAEDDDFSVRDEK